MTEGICLRDNISYPGMEHANMSCYDSVELSFERVPTTVGTSREAAPSNYELFQTNRPSFQTGIWKASTNPSPDQESFPWVPIVTLPLLAAGPSGIAAYLGINLFVVCGVGFRKETPKKPEEEICDRKDNDGDGLIDEVFDFQTDPNNCGECGNMCSFENAIAACVDSICVIDRCVEGWDNPNEVKEDGCECSPRNEVCDNIDNDCDGLTDEEISKPCYSGPSDTRKIGECHDGVATCAAGAWGGCVGDQIPTSEFCDNLDNDCNGVTDEGWVKTFGGAGEEFWSFQLTTDGGFILAGITDSAGAGGDDAWLVKVDDSGDEQWSKTFGGVNNDNALSVQQIEGGGFILAGITFSSGLVETMDTLLIKTDHLGNEEWNKTFGGANEEWAWFVSQTEEGGFILGGSTKSYGAGGYDVLLIKTDHLGNKEWEKTFGGQRYDEAWSAQQTADGGYIIAASTKSYGAGDEDAWLIKTDRIGNIVWDHTFGGAGWDRISSVQQTIDSGFILAGRITPSGAGPADVENTDAWLIKTDRLGDKEWGKTFGALGDNDSADSAQQTMDGGFVFVGMTTAPAGFYGNPWIIKTGHLGNKEWGKSIGRQQGRDFVTGVQQTADGGFVIAGDTYSSGAWLIKTCGQGD